MNLPVLAICGYSSSGKTTLITSLLPRLTARGLRVAVCKHDVHGLSFDRAGKDSDRLFRAGADAWVRAPGESLLRLHDHGVNLSQALKLMIPFYDLILVEGHKHTPLPNKVWLRRHARDRCPKGISGVRLDFGPKENRLSGLEQFVDDWLPRRWLQTSLYAGILIGGKSRRMGRSKHLLKVGAQTWLEKVVATVRPFAKEVVLLGDGQIPPQLKSLTVLPDARGFPGPLAGMIAALRWAPLVSWLFAACDLPLIAPWAVQWLLATRAPGVWATIPKSSKGFEPLLAHYDFRARALLEAARRPAAIVGERAVFSPKLPCEIAAAWTNCNTPGDLQRTLK